MTDNMSRLCKVAATGALVSSLASAPGQSASGNSFGEVISFVNQHSRLLVLSDDRSGASIAVRPAMQGRVLTSSAEGASGRSFGWITSELVGSGKIQEHINAVGGEDRIWIGPEGSQFSIFFVPGVAFELDHWFTPAPVDTEAFDVRRAVGSTGSTPRPPGRCAFRGISHRTTHWSVII
jgi:hypothetical protein